MVYTLFTLILTERKSDREDLRAKDLQAGCTRRNQVVHR